MVNVSEKRQLTVHDEEIVHISLVSHRHGALVLSALDALSRSLPRGVATVRVWLTLNLPEPDLLQAVQNKAWPFKIVCISNSIPIGFGQNHNKTFIQVQAAGAGRWFVVMNPDIFWPSQAESFWLSLAQDDWPDEVGLVCPLQIDAQGHEQDFARALITPWGLVARVFRRMLGLRVSGVASSLDNADWVNGACMVWRSQAFAAIKGFDERFFMYCEDTDICMRLKLAGWRMQGAHLMVIHDARRNTGRSWRHLAWHIRSVLRLWCSRAYWTYWWRYKFL